MNRSYSTRNETDLKREVPPAINSPGKRCTQRQEMGRDRDSGDLDIER